MIIKTAIVDKFVLNRWEIFNYVIIPYYAEILKVFALKRGSYALIKC